VATYFKTFGHFLSNLGDFLLFYLVTLRRALSSIEFPAAPNLRILFFELKDLEFARILDSATEWCPAVCHLGKFFYTLALNCWPNVDPKAYYCRIYHY